MTINTILCATKGSKSCKVAEDKAIEIAKENNSKLIFLYVIDTKFLEKVSGGGEWTEEDAVSGLKNIGSVILDIAKEKALENGIPEENVITEEREGGIVSQIRIIVKEYAADLVVIGRPESDTGFLERHLLMKEGTESFIKRLREKIGCEIMII